MAYFKPIAKWNIKEKKWDYDISYEEAGKSYSYINYYDEYEDVNYLIFSPGIRAENVNEKNNALNSGLQIESIVNHYCNIPGNYSVKMQLMDADAPIIEEAKQQAKFIDNLASNINTKSITLIGYSKCGVMNFYVPSFFENEDSFKKTNLINAATPYKGTIVAANKLIFKEFYNGIIDTFKSKKIAEMLSKKFQSFYENICSNSHMDYDIALPNGVTEDKKDLYDKDFISNVFRKENIDSIKKLRSFTNVSTGIDNRTMTNAIRNLNIGNIQLCLMEKFILKNKSDGIVPIESQLEVEKYLDTNSKHISSCTHNIHSDKRCLNELLNIIDDTLDVKKYLKR